MKGGSMDNGGITLSSIFDYRDRGAEQAKSKALEGLAAFSALKRDLEKEAGNIKWPLAFTEVVGQIGSLLNVKLGDVISAAWNKYRLLMKYGDPAAYAPDEVFLVPLAEHTVISKHRPHIDVLVGDRSVGRIEFAVDVSLTLNGFVAKIKGGRLREIKVGTCKAKGTIACGDMLLLEKESASLDLPGSVDLGEGIPIK
jgi:hypothetical protein